MRKILKFPLLITDKQTFTVPGADVQWLDAQIQHGSLVAWAVVDPAAPVRLCVIRIIGTGNKMPDMTGFQYLSTVQMAGGGLIWHVWVEA